MQKPWMMSSHLRLKNLKQLQSQLVRNPKPRPGRKPPVESHTQMAKILLAEDDTTMVSLLKTLLKMEGFEVVALDVYSDVAAAVEREKPHALFMDVHLGGKSGMQILESIRGNQKNSGVRIIMTSGMNMKEECISRGADAFLLKPFMPDDLIKALQ
jgi:DNA-binding response OmpR family regulator